MVVRQFLKQVGQLIWRLCFPAGKGKRLGMLLRLPTVKSFLLSSFLSWSFSSLLFRTFEISERAFFTK